MRLTAAVLGMTMALTGSLSAAVAIGDKLEAFTLKDQSGKDVNLASYKDKKALVLIFVATRCPVSNAYNTRMATLAQAYAPKGVAIVGINANSQEPPAEIAEHAQKHGLTFPILKDQGNVYADRFGAQVTPEAYVYDPSWTLRYHGRIDDDRSGQNIQSRDLEVALDSVLAGKVVPIPETKAFGCSIKRVGQ
jgi:peroxiredoxin